MEREHSKTGSQDLAEIWRSAEQRRAEDIGERLGHFFEQRRQSKVTSAEASFPVGKPVLGQTS